MARTNPRTETANTDPEVGPNPSPETSLVESFGGVVDDLRQLYTDFGMRPYRVFSVVGKWSGGRRGYGEWVLQSEVELLPTPKVMVEQGPGQFGRLAEVSNPAGLTERGSIKLFEISPRYTEDDVRQLFHIQPETKPVFEGFIELSIDRRDGQTKRRRFAVDHAPQRRAGSFDWTVTLRSSDQNRDRGGAFPNVGR